MYREDKFVMSHRGYAVDLSSFRRRDLYEHDEWFMVDAVWFRRKSGVTAACIGYLDDGFRRTAPRDVIEFLEQYEDGRYGAKCLARWDGTSFWCAGQDPEENARYLELLKPMLDGFPAIPPGHDGWWRF